MAGYHRMAPESRRVVPPRAGPAGYDRRTWYRTRNTITPARLCAPPRLAAQGIGRARARLSSPPRLAVRGDQASRARAPSRPGRVPGDRRGRGGAFNSWL